MSAVLTTIENGVAVITLNRPEVLNALDRTLGEAAVTAFEACAADEEVRVIILTGAGAGFCAGGDIKAALRYVEQGGDPQQYFSEVILLLNRLVLGLLRARKPVIAAINGAIGGAGISVAAACDLRIAAVNAKFKQAYTSIALVPDGGWTFTVPALIGTARALELVFTDPLLDAATALRIGLVHEVVDEGKALERARAAAERLAQGPAAAFATAKSLLNEPRLRDIGAQLERERQAVMAQSRTPEFTARVQQFVAGAAKARG